MIIALPTADGVLCPHFGHCREFTIVEVDNHEKRIVRLSTMSPPPHEPGIFPKWLSQLGCNIVIVGGMGGRAMNFLESAGIKVICGAPSKKPEEIVNDYLEGQLITGTNLCDEVGGHGGGQKRYRDKESRHDF
jgi:ATP-binding protein involved in chromosome partitioning